MKINLDAMQKALSVNDTLPAGGYVCKIHEIEDKPDIQCLKVTYDIEEGDYSGYFGVPTGGFHPGVFHACYKDTALSFFAKFIGAVEESNSDYKFDSENEHEMVGKLVGLVLREEEYLDKQKDIKIKLGVGKYTSVDKIRAGNYPEFGLKPLKNNTFGRI